MFSLEREDKGTSKSRSQSFRVLAPVPFGLCTEIAPGLLKKALREPRTLPRTPFPETFRVRSFMTLLAGFFEASAFKRMGPCASSMFVSYGVMLSWTPNGPRFSALPSFLVGRRDFLEPSNG